MNILNSVINFLGYGINVVYVVATLFAICILVFVSPYEVIKKKSKKS